VKVTREVITDLLPLYLSGEASADSRALVDEFLAQDPEFARSVNDSRERLLTLEIPRTLTTENEMKTLERTKRLLRWHGAFLGFAFFLSFLPVGIYFDDRGIFWLWSGFPAGAIIAAVLAALTWTAYFALRRRFQITTP
jgi:hypothetical protein